MGPKKTIPLVCSKINRILGFKRTIFGVMTILLGITAVWADTEKVIYGQDNRYEVYDYPNEAIKTFVHSTAAMISSEMLQEVKKGIIEIKGPKIKDEYPLCRKERFRTQMAAALCSGFLVGDDLLVTAGHCLGKNGSCPSEVWVFDFHKKNHFQNRFFVPHTSLYSCAEVVEWKETEQVDYALIRLDRQVEGRKPLVYRKKGLPAKDTPLVMIGHPLGLPTKITDGAWIRENTNPNHFVANLDAFGGNSGSAVFNLQEGIIEGILVAGESDFETDAENDCFRTKRCENEGCMGEHVQRITKIKALYH